MHLNRDAASFNRSALNTLTFNASSSTLSDRFSGLSLRYGDLYPCDFSIEQIAVAFITALAYEALSDFNMPQPSYEYIDIAAENPVRIQMQAVRGVPQALTVRANVMWALRTLAKNLLSGPHIWSLQFYVQSQRRDIYNGVLDNRNRGLIALQQANQTANATQLASESKRALDARNSNILNTSLTSLSLGYEQYNVVMRRKRDLLPKIDIFSTILDFLLALGPKNNGDIIRELSWAGRTWIFVIYNDKPTTPQPLREFHMMSILNAIARQYAHTQIYQESIFNFFIDGKWIASGCVTKPEDGREWCRGLEL